MDQNDDFQPHMRIVLVEDAPFLRYAFARLLRMYGFDVREAVDGSDAIECVNEFHPHLVLTDLMMPVMDGIELIKRLHQDPKTSSLPIVAITADATEHTKQLACAAGARDVITKPIDFPTFLTHIRDLDVFGSQSTPETFLN